MKKGIGFRSDDEDGYLPEDGNVGNGTHQRDEEGSNCRVTLREFERFAVRMQKRGATEVSAGDFCVKFGGSE